MTKIKRAETIYVFEYVLINGRVSNAIVVRFLFDGPEITLGLPFYSVLLIVDKDYVLSQKNVMGMLRAVMGGCVSSA